jgi:hypothetical protein
MSRGILDGIDAYYETESSFAIGLSSVVDPSSAERKSSISPRRTESENTRAEVAVPPSRTATQSLQRRSPSSARDSTIMRVQAVGRRQWTKECGYRLQARVENTFFRYKTIIGPRLRSCHSESQKVEAMIACNILNTIFSSIALGASESFAISD